MLNARKLAGTIIAAILLVGGGVAALPSLGVDLSSPFGGSKDGPCTNTTHYFTQDPGKESIYAFGPMVEQTTPETIRQNLHDRRSLDPVLVAANEVSLGGIPINQLSMNAEIAKLTADCDYRTAQISKLETFEATASNVAMVPTKAGGMSMYMLSDGKGSYTLHQAPSLSDGTAIQFTYADGSTELLRLNCGYQPYRAHGFPPGIPNCGTPNCVIVPHVTPPPPPPPVCVKSAHPRPSSAYIWNPPTCSWVADSKYHRSDTVPPGGTVPKGPDPLQTAAAGLASGTSGNGATNGAPHTDAGTTATVSGATAGTTTITGSPVTGASQDTNAGTTATPVPTPICDPDIGICK